MLLTINNSGLILSSSFIEKYGTHIVVSVKVGGKDVIYVRQHQTSPLQPPEVAKLMQKFADQRFQSVSNGTTSFETRERAGKEKVNVLWKIHISLTGISFGG